MKIGIISMQRIVNYGSFLQAFALKQTLEKLSGNEVGFWDFHINDPIVVNTPWYKKGKLFHIAKKAYHYIKKGNVKSQFQICYERALAEYLNVSKYKYRPKVDLLVVGSDEVFNCLQTNYSVGYSLELFGKNQPAKRIISYAASFGTTTLEELEKYNVLDEVKKELNNNFDELSLRDENSIYTAEKLTNRKLQMHIDPVFLGDFDQYIPEKVDMKDYILVYSYSRRISDPEEIEAIKKFARDNNKKLLTIGNHQGWEDVSLDLMPFEMLAYVKHADYIITDTFHGSVFSIKFNKPFVTVIRDSNKQKLSYLLKQFGLQDRQLLNICNLSQLLNTPINFDAVNDCIKKEKQRSEEYLMQQIKLTEKVLN